MDKVLHLTKHRQSDGKMANDDDDGDGDGDGHGHDHDHDDNDDNNNRAELAKGYVSFCGYMICVFGRSYVIVLYAGLTAHEPRDPS